MSNINHSPWHTSYGPHQYYDPYQPQYVYRPSSDNLNAIYQAIKGGLVLTLLVILAWTYWSENSYKYSSDRLSSLILNKYQAISAHNAMLDDTLMFDVTNIQVSNDKTSVTADVNLQNKVTRVVKSTDKVSYLLTPDCTLLDLNCIAV